MSTRPSSPSASRRRKPDAVEAPDDGITSAAAGEADAVAPLRLEKSFGYLFKQANRAFTRALTRQLKPYHITLAQWYFLRELWQEQGITQRELSRRMDVSEATTAVALESMAKAGLIERQRDANQRNSLNVFLTDKGKALQKDLVGIPAHVNEDATVGLLEEQLDQLRDTVAVMIKNLNGH